MQLATAKLEQQSAISAQVRWIPWRRDGGGEALGERGLDFRIGRPLTHIAPLLQVLARSELLQNANDAYSNANKVRLYNSRVEHSPVDHCSYALSRVKA